MLKSDAISLQKFLNERKDNLKLDTWSLEHQGRNIQVEHIPGYKNKAADCLSRLPFVTRKRNDNPLKGEISINMAQTEDNTKCCPMCVVDINDTKALQQQDRFCTKIAKMTEDPKSRFNEKALYVLIALASYIILIKKMVKSIKPLYFPKSLLKQSSRKCMIILAILALATHIL